MKPLKLVTTPTRHRRLNELIGLLVLVAATLLLLALVSYRPTDPSLNTVGGYALPITGPASSVPGSAISSSSSRASPRSGSRCWPAPLDGPGCARIRPVRRA